MIPRVAYTLQLLPKSLGKASEESAAMTLDTKSQRYVLDIKMPLDTKTWNAAQSTHLSYRLYEEFPRAPFAQDAFELKRVYGVFAGGAIAAESMGTHPPLHAA
ncbi:hypothetical protein [uncultured Herbaspirillum sp.]|uniref:hypothetical protein n=1 Tax=uncultured Herbaspirillum sp. TaxID=160236 RepID=UPI0026353647|nr:hypothetical protein [uncultured Herbaspirillum sp.]